MLTLEIILNAAIICVALVSFVTVLFLLIRSGRLDKVNTHDDLMKVFKNDDKFFSVIMPILFTCMSAIILTGALITWPKFCAMQLVGLVLSAFWLLLAIVYVIITIKKK